VAKTDRELLRAFLGGHVESLGELAGRHESDLYAFLMRFVGDSQTAQDLFQETFLHVWNKREQFDLDRDVRPWLFTIAANLARDWLRQQSRQHALSLDNHLGEGDPDSPSFVNLLADDGESPLAALERDEQRRLVRQALDSMPEHLRAVLILAYYQKFKYREIASVLGIPVGTVKSRLHAAVSRLLSVWQGSGGAAAAAS
jgi:RNA polymerase sigma-70 factor (ECF subfamily)